MAGALEVGMVPRTRFHFITQSHPIRVFIRRPFEKIDALVSRYPAFGSPYCVGERDSILQTRA
jgi:hypothetical protein